MPSAPVSAVPSARVSRARLRDGVREGVPFGIAAVVLSLSFSVVALQAGMPGWVAVLMSAVVFAGSAQFAAVGIIASGGGLGAAVAAAALMNSRFLPMGIALGPSLPGGPLRRAVQGQAVVDSSWVMAAREDGSYDRSYLFGNTGIQYVGWLGGTVVGVLIGDGIGDPQALGLDAVFPAFFAGLLVTELRDGGARVVALLGAVIALALVPVAPAGVPVLAASAAALLGLRRRTGER